MKIQVDFNTECPFYYREDWQYSEYTSGYDNKCTITKSDCSGLMNGDCPLKNGPVVIVGNKNEGSS